jgi:membrane-associated protease RseP (regulator of RpoE activity)
MFNSSETFALIAITFLAFIFLVWGYNRAKSYGKLGVLAWLQSVALMTPWILFFGLFAVGVYLNFMGIILLLVSSAIAYIYLGNRLRAEGKNEIFKQGAQKRIEEEQKERQLDSTAENSTANHGATSQENKQIKPEIIPIKEEDLKVVKSIFGIDTFFATQTIAYQEGAIFKGNLRGEAAIVHQQLTEKLRSKLGDKYRLFLVETPEGKPVIIVLPSSNDPQPTNLAQKNLALVLFLATVFTSLEAMSLLQGFDLVNDWERYSESIPLTLGLWIILIAHEIGHRIGAKRYNLRLSVPFFLPNWQIGSFGAITRFESLLPNRTALFDVAFAGPAVGGIVSLLMLISGLYLSHSGSTFQIPTGFFQGSILVGCLAKIILGSALESPLLDIHPLTALGWLGLIITALNLLPAGQLDGGRIVQAIYGRKIARRTSIGTLIVLGIVAIANPNNSIALYWGIVILFLQRDLERPSLNEVTEPDDTRAAWALFTLFLTLCVLIPLSPSLAGRLGIGI